MCVTLDSLDLAAEELQAAHKAIERLAYQKWEQAGRPEGGDPSEFWRAAEQEWIDFYYVPERYPHPK